MDEPSTDGLLADKLDGLFRRVTRKDGKTYTYDDVASAIQASGTTISASYIWQLRKGEKDNPTYKHLRALADFFGVPVRYFFEDDTEERINQKLDELRAERERLRQLRGADDVQLVALRASEMDPNTRAVFAEMMTAVVRDRARRADAAGAEPDDPTAR